MKSLDHAALDCLIALIDEGNFDRAALRLSITQSAVSQRLRALEVQIGQPLIVRSRPLRVTSAGQVLLRHARQLQALRADVALELGETLPSKDRVAIAVNADSLATWVLPALQPVVDSGISLELIVDDQDFTHDWLREGRVLGCVSTVNTALRGCRLSALGTMRYVAVASPKLVRQQLEARPVLQAGHLGRVPFVVFNRKDDVQAQWVGQALGVNEPRLLQRYVPSSEAYVRAVECGWGIGVAAWPLVAHKIETGSLLRLHPDVHIDVDLFWHQWKLTADPSAGPAGSGLPSSVLDRIGQALASGALDLSASPRERAGD
ncbi:LysR family transcriptional regulator (chromosome initiation inhibitor) [Sphaerotilus hippei]|uniref:LysR family transcriptional regulator (Chromosome initiation inhibitor) n=1 Tax=Sphaerotilus hippei TaxID=744406 RepID=A0A318H251_9BURK|nr:LysR family transcriptional regulator ArgP [Sphaerotilus hippei]PXW96679.1 LysR family transcriptional regulator (chromosome initiation inhibitor) [Sphaerotilus hippei]